MTKTHYWIKLYHDILYNPKMRLMDDHTWRRTIELFLIAGIFYQEGALPEVEEIALRLRTDKQDILAVLHTLEALGTAQRDEYDEWWITNFAERQRKMTKAERMQAYRES